MNVLYVLLALSILAILAAVSAMFWRLRWHLRRPHITPPNPDITLPSPIGEVVPEQEPVEKA
ncbi:MAG TPA: hypothetical protein VN872_05825 [Candidatus Acidoferrum sp.]|nr:hypothetical protein [Candidatus Acidoferrum sp.]